MARKKETAEAMSAAVELENQTPVTQPEPSGAVPAGEEEGTEQSEAFGKAGREAGGVSSDEAAEQLTLVYIGPSLPYGKMRSSMILTGTEEEINGFLAEIKEQYPEVTHLLVPPDKLTDALEKVARKGTILHKYYEDMLAKSRASRKG